MNRPCDFVSEPFEFGEGGVLCVDVGPAATLPHGMVEFRLEGSTDKTHWAELTAGAVSTGERVQVACRGRTESWGRIRLWSFGGNARVSVRRFPGGGPRRA